MATAVYPALVFLAASTVMTECVLTLAQGVTLLWGWEQIRPLLPLLLFYLLMCVRLLARL